MRLKQASPKNILNFSGLIAPHSSSIKPRRSKATFDRGLKLTSLQAFIVSPRKVNLSRLNENLHIRRRLPLYRTYRIAGTVNFYRKDKSFYPRSEAYIAASIFQLFPKKKNLRKKIFSFSSKANILINFVELFDLKTPQRLLHNSFAPKKEKNLRLFLQTFDRYDFIPLKKEVPCSYVKTKFIKSFNSNIANKRTLRVVSRCIEPTLSRLLELKKQILSVLKGTQIKVVKVEFYKT